MGDWFTVEQLDGDTFAISEYQHWEETHCFLLCGSERAVLIDTGLGVGNIREIVDRLTNLPVMVVTTHVHWDHIGGHKFFDHIAVHVQEKHWLTEAFPIPLQVVKRNLMLRPCEFPEGFAADEYEIFQGAPERVFDDGDRICLGNRELIVVHTPGHSPGHCCFYEADRKRLYSGDLIYNGCLDAFYPSTDPWQFMHSVRKVQSLKIEQILPGHHRLIIPTDLINEIEAAFSALEIRGQLRQGNGVFDFDYFQIHI